MEPKDYRQPTSVHLYRCVRIERQKFGSKLDCQLPFEMPIHSIASWVANFYPGWTVVLAYRLPYDNSLDV